MTSTTHRSVSSQPIASAPSEAVDLGHTSQSAPTGIPAAAARWLAVTRICLGLIFLWAFLDKTFGLGYSTPAARAWIRGGSPTGGFLSHVDVGPFTGFFHAIAAHPLVDWLFMLGLLGIGVALVLGVGLRVAAVAGAAMLILMWAAEWPPAMHTVTGEASGSVHPFLDYHLIYALVLAVLATTDAGSTWGLGARWRNTGLVRRFPWTR